jgi:signal transduction histidine kinase
VQVEIGREDGHVRVAVVDTGEGIAPEDQPYVFDQFYRGEKSRSRGSGGAGLGLAIARGIIEAHRGSIRVESSPGKGSRFVVTL